MDHCVAVSANRYQIFNWIHLVLASHLTQRDYVVDVDEVLADFSIELSKIEGADSALIPVVFNAPSSRHRVTFVGVD